MVIALDARYINGSPVKQLEYFTRNLLITIAQQRPEDQFLCITDKPITSKEQLPENVLNIVVRPEPKNYLTYHWWYNVRLPLIFKKYKADLFIGTYGLLSSKQPTRQIILLHELSFLHKQLLRQPHSVLFYKKNTARSLRHAGAIITTSFAVKEELEKAYPFTSGKANVCYSYLEKEYPALDWEQKGGVKKAFSSGAEYFLFNYTHATANELIHILKSFSIFKKWQKSNLKLLIIADGNSMHQQQFEKLDSYKYKNDVAVLCDLDEHNRQKIFAAAYALIHPVVYEGFGYNILQAMQCKIPVMAYDTPAARELMGDAGFYATASDVASIAEQMKLVYKNENLRNNHIEDCKKKASNYSWQKTCAVIIATIDRLTS